MMRHIVNLLLVLGIFLLLAGCAEEDACQTECVHVRDGVVATDECFRGTRPPDPDRPDVVNNQSQDPRDPNRSPYFQTQGDYTLHECGCQCTNINFLNQASCVDAGHQWMCSQ